MGHNLPPHLSYSQTQELKEAMFGLARDFARKHGLDPERTQLALGFICAHYAAHAGVLGAPYKEWLREQQPGTTDADAGAQGADSVPSSTASTPPTSESNDGG